MIRVVHPGSGSRLFTYPGSRGQKDNGIPRIRIRNTGIMFIVVLLVADTSWRWREARRSRARAASGALTPPARLSWLSRWVNLTLWTSSSLYELLPHFMNFILTLWTSSWIRCSLVVSVADPGGLFRILDLNFSIPDAGSKKIADPDCIKELSIFNPKNCF